MWRLAARRSRLTERLSASFADELDQARAERSLQQIQDSLEGGAGEKCRLGCLAIRFRDADGIGGKLFVVRRHKLFIHVLPG